MNMYMLHKGLTWWEVQPRLVTWISPDIVEFRKQTCNFVKKISWCDVTSYFRLFVDKSLDKRDVLNGKYFDLKQNEVIHSVFLYEEFSKTTDMTRFLTSFVLSIFVSIFDRVF